MASKNTNATDRGFFAFLVYGLAWFVLCIVVGIVVEWFAMTMVYADEGVYHSLRLLESELSYLESTQLITNGYGATIIGKLLSVQQSFYLFIVEQLHLKDSLMYLSQHRHSITTFERLGLLNPAQYAIATLNMMQVMTLRVVVIVLSMPIFVVMMLWALGEGLSRRSIRRYQVTHETGNVFHHAKRLKFYSLVIPVTVYLAWPNELSPITLFGPFALIYSIAWMVMAAKYKRLW